MRQQQSLRTGPGILGVTCSSHIHARGVAGGAWGLGASLRGFLCQRLLWALVLRTGGGCSGRLTGATPAGFLSTQGAASLERAQSGLG